MILKSTKNNITKTIFESNTLNMKTLIFATLLFLKKYNVESPGEGNGNPLQYSCLDNPMDRGAWRAIVHRVTESRI